MLLLLCWLFEKVDPFFNIFNISQHKSRKCLHTSTYKAKKKNKSICFLLHTHHIIIPHAIQCYIPIRASEHWKAEKNLLVTIFLKKYAYIYMYISICSFLSMYECVYMVKLLKDKEKGHQPKTGKLKWSDDVDNDDDDVLAQ